MANHGDQEVTEERRTTVQLEGVPETLLWTLYHRAIEARRPDGLLHDQKAIELIERIDYPFEERLGGSNTGLGRMLGQFQALRVRCFDEEIGRFLHEHPKGTIVALGEGLETSFWRLGRDQVENVRWLTVDLPHVIELRKRLLPPEPDRQRLCPFSVVDERWMDEVDDSEGVLITAQGLFMYLEPEQVHRILTVCAERFPGGSLLFDAVTRQFSAATMRGRMRAQGYAPPPMPWSVDSAERERIRNIPGVTELRKLRMPRGRGRYRYVSALFDLLPGAIDPRMRIMVAHLGSRRLG
jgi:O-methyltransferase involved in polyketide biosynthesis